MLSDRSIREAFEDALRLDPGQRGGYLDRVCPDPESRAALQRLLTADGSPGPLDGGLSADRLASVLQEISTAGEPDQDRSGPSLVGHTIGRYRLLRLLGSGGMGDVYEAEQQEPHRLVALKILRPGALAPGALSRFEYEAEVLARLEHPGIARLYESGSFDSDFGTMPWFAMELVQDALPITTYATREELGIDQRLLLFAAICDAVHHGHRKGFIHRDLKPGNLLVAADGSPRVIDYGVARAVGPEITIATLHTLPGQIVGSLRYMSPEQCAADQHAVDAQSDVYSLGVVLHELLTGGFPYSIDDSSSILNIPRVICETPPRRPSATNPRLAGDIDEIVLRALEKDPEQRYESAAALARDIRHHLSGETIDARRHQRLYVLRKGIARHRLAVFSSASVFTLALVAAVIFTLLWNRSEAQRALAENRAAELRHETYDSTISLAQTTLENEESADTLALLDACPKDLRHWEWYHLRAAADGATSVHETTALAFGKLSDSPAPVPEVDPQPVFAISPVSGLAAIGGVDGRVHLWDLRSRAVVATLSGLDHVLGAVAFSADGTRVAAREALPAGTQSRITVWAVRDGRELAQSGARDIFGKLALSADGRLCVTGSDRDVLLLDVEHGDTVGRLSGSSSPVNQVALSPDSTRVATNGYGWFALWNLESRKLIATEQVDRWNRLAFSPDGSRLAVAESNGSIRFTEPSSGRSLSAIARAPAVPWGLAFSPDGHLLAAGFNGVLDLYDTDTLQRLRRLHTFARMCCGLTFLEHPLRVAVGCADGRLREFEIEQDSTVTVLGQHLADALAASPDGRFAATAGRDRTIALWDLNTGHRRAHWLAHETGYKLNALAFSPDSAMLASAGAGHMVKVWSVPTGKQLLSLGPMASETVDFAWSPDGKHLFCATREAHIEIYGVPSGRWIESFQAGRLPSPDGDYFARQNPRTVAVCPSTGMVATSGHEQLIRLWRWPGWTPLGTLAGHRKLVRDLAFSRDGRRLASAGYDGTVRVWDLANRRCVATLSEANRHRVRSVAFSPDGRRLLSLPAGKSARLWDVEGAGRLLLNVSDGQSSPLLWCCFSGDGRSIVAVTDHQQVVRIDAPGFTGSATARAN